MKAIHRAIYSIAGMPRSRLRVLLTPPSRPDMGRPMTLTSISADRRLVILFALGRAVDAVYRRFKGFT